jgi:hypothetical protein
VRAALSIQAAVGEQKPLHRPAMNKMLFDDLRDILSMHKAIPDRVRIDHNHRPVLALVKTPQFVRPHFALQTGVLERILEGVLELPAASSGTTGTGCVFVPLIGTDKEMMLKLCHFIVPSDYRIEVVVRRTLVSETIPI